MDEEDLTGRLIIVWRTVDYDRALVFVNRAAHEPVRGKKETTLVIAGTPLWCEHPRKNPDMSLPSYGYLLPGSLDGLWEVWLYENYFAYEVIL